MDGKNVRGANRNLHTLGSKTQGTRTLHIAKAFFESNNNNNKCDECCDDDDNDDDDTVMKMMMIKVLFPTDPPTG